MKQLKLEWAGAFSFSFWIVVAAAGCSFSPGAGSGGGSGSGSGPPRITIVYPGNGGSSGSGTGGTGGGSNPNTDGGSTVDGDTGCGTNLTGTIRDFKQSHPDFEHFTYIGDDRAIVTDRLGADGKPIYGGNPTTPTTLGGKASFDQWYHDVPGVNQSALVTLPFNDSGGGIFSYDNAAFFPIDNMFWGNEGNPHNFHFTYELHTRFLYKGGEIFHFRGDDDVFTYINGHLVVNLGGIHLPEEAMVDLDAEASNLGITPGSAYNLDFFFNERHQSMSNFHMDTTLFFVDCGHVVE